MRKLPITLVFLFLLTKITSQNPPQVSIDSMLTNIDKTSFTSGVLYDRAVPWANLSSFNEAENISSAKHFEQSLLELHKASDEQKFISHIDLRSFYTDINIQDKVDIGIINAAFHRLNYNEDNENDGALRVQNDKFEKINNNEEVFLEDHALIVSPLKQYVMGNDINYHFDPVFLMEETQGKNLVSLVANFDTASDFTIYENGSFSQENIQIHYEEEGIKIVTFTGVFSDGSAKTTQGIIYVKLANQTPPPDGILNVIGFQSNYSFQGYDESSPIFGKLDYRIFYHLENGNPVETLLKPIIIIDGFDPQDRRQIEDSDPHPLSSDDEHSSIVETMFYYNNNGQKVEIIPILRDLGYDVVIVNHPNYTVGNLTIDGGADFIERNALTHVSLYEELNNTLATNNSNEELVIVGPSMGGQISRYALSYMESQGIDHNARLWISVDSPHLGANIPLGLQALVRQAAPDSAMAQDFVNNQLGSVAAKQQLIEQLHGWNNDQIHQDYLNAKTTSQGYSETRGHPFFINYYNNQYNTGLPNSNGYPQNLRRVALINGSLNGNRNFSNPFTGQEDNYINDSQIGVNIRGFQEVCAPWPYQNNCINVHIASLESFNMPGAGSNNKISRYKATFDDNSMYVTNNNSRGNMDNVSGGWFPGFNALAAPLNGTDPIVPVGSFWSNWEDHIFLDILSDLFGGAELTVYTNEHVSPFIPTISALGFLDPDFNWSQVLDRNLICTGEIPFDTYYGPKNNEQHTSFTEESITWLLAEIEGNEQPPTVYLDANDLQGPDSVCVNDLATFYFANCVAPPVDYWEVSSNLQIITSDDSSVTVESLTSSSTSGFVRAFFPFNNVVEKTFWMGVPTTPGYLNGPEIVSTASIVAYNGGVSEGATSYKWWLPYPFDTVSPIDYSSDNWQTYPNVGRSNSHIFTGYGENNGFVQLMGENECGLGGAALLYVEHGNGGGGSGQNPVVPYPNTSDTDFKLDFRSYPPGTYYIFIYDMYSNIKYQGESSNIEKTVGTLNIQNGTYYLHVHDGNTVLIKQLVVQH